MGTLQRRAQDLALEQQLRVAGRGAGDVAGGRGRGARRRRRSGRRLPGTPGELGVELALDAVGRQAHRRSDEVADVAVAQEAVVELGEQPEGPPVGVDLPLGSGDVRFAQQVLDGELHRRLDRPQRRLDRRGPVRGEVGGILAHGQRQHHDLAHPDLGRERAGALRRRVARVVGVERQDHAGRELLQHPEVLGGQRGAAGRDDVRDAGQVQPDDVHVALDDDGGLPPGDLAAGPVRAYSVADFL